MARPKKNWITFEIDGREVRAAEGSMLVDAAKEGDVEIPFFCYEPKLGHPVGACRMCLVEIEGIPKLQTSCSTAVRDGMVVNTTSDRVKHAQNAVVEFLLVNHPLDCPVCDKGGECPLQDISYGWGAGHSRFIEPKRHFKKPIELSPLIAIDRERCILCYRCVRFSQEIAEDYQLVFLERGDHTFVGTHDGHPYVAPFSGNIIELCPVGALTSRAYRFRARPWDIEDSGSVCALCPSQCNVKLTIRDDVKVVRVLARDNVEVDDGWLCDKGRFAYQAFSSEERLTAPLVRDGGYLREVSWERALSDAAAALKRSGADTAAILGGSTTNEEGFLVQHLLREGLGSPHLSSGAGAPPAGLRTLARPDLSARVSDIDHAGAILVLDTELVDEAPILDLRVRKAVRRNGARLVVASSRPSTLDSNADATVRFAPGCSEAAIGALAAALGSPRAGGLDDLAARARVSPAFVPGHPMIDGVRAANASAPTAVPADLVRAAADTLRDAGDVVVIWGERVFAGERGSQALDAVIALADTLDIAGKEESGLIGIPESTNGRGLREVGCTPTLGPGLADAPATGDPDSARGALLLLEAELPEPVLTRASSVIAFASFRTEALEAQADVVFPAEIYAEKEGTITHPDGRLQRVRQALGHASEVRPGWWVLAELCERSGAGLSVLGSPQISALIAERVPLYAGLTLDVIGGLGTRWQDHDGGAALTPEPLPTESLVTPPDAPSGLQLAHVPTLWSGPEFRHSPSLRFLDRGPHALLSPRDAGRLGVGDDEEIELSVQGERAVATALVRSSVPDDSVFVTDVDLPTGPVAIRPARSGAAVA